MLPGLPLGQLRQTLRATVRIPEEIQLEVPVEGTVGGDLALAGGGWDSSRQAAPARIGLRQEGQPHTGVSDGQRSPSIEREACRRRGVAREPRRRGRRGGSGRERRHGPNSDLDLDSARQSACQPPLLAPGSGGQDRARNRPPRHADPHDPCLCGHRSLTATSARRVPPFPEGPHLRDQSPVPPVAGRGAAFVRCDGGGVRPGSGCRCPDSDGRDLHRAERQGVCRLADAAGGRRAHRRTGRLHRTLRLHGQGEPEGRPQPPPELSPLRSGRRLAAVGRRSRRAGPQVWPTVRGEIPVDRRRTPGDGLLGGRARPR